MSAETDNLDLILCAIGKTRGQLRRDEVPPRRDRDEILEFLKLQSKGIKRGPRVCGFLGVCFPNNLTGAYYIKQFVSHLKMENGWEVIEDGFVRSIYSDSKRSRLGILSRPIIVTATSPNLEFKVGL